MQDTGKPPIPMRWPGDANIAVSVVVAFEAFHTRSQYNVRPGPAGKPDQSSLSYAEYGPKTGVWRVLRLLESESIHASFHTSGLAAERWPLTLQEVMRRGHEIVGHGWTNDNLGEEATPEGERKDVLDTIAAIEKAVGVRPEGWSSPGSKGSDAKYKSLVTEVKVNWIGDDASDDVPFVREMYGRDVVIMPRNNFPANDLTLWLWPANGPGVYFESFKDAFDELYEEGAQGSPKWIELVIHCHIGARPGLTHAIRRSLRYAKQHSKVWIARRGDIAAHVLNRHLERSR
jgi:peptidoglycan/xylan/chitin deacetylase (PgdA/CDA1 family)